MQTVLVNIIGKKVKLEKATAAQMDRIYYWRYEEKQQEAKKWNGPYIPEPWLSKDQHRK